MGLFKRKKKEIRLCPNCRTPIPEGLAFCDSCGLRVTPPPSCAKCHLPLAPDPNFCESCGTPVGTAPASPGGEGKVPTEQGEKKAKKGRRAKKPAPKKDEFVHPAMLAVEKDEPKTPANPEEPEEKGRDETGITPATDHNDKPESGILHLPARRRIPTWTPALAIIAILCLILGAAVLTGLVNGPAPGSARALATPPQTPPVTQPPAISAATTMTPAGEREADTQSFVTRPTQVPPESYRIWLQEERDPITNLVTVIYNGGKGQRAVREVSVRLTRSDGEVLEQVFRPLVIGEGVELQGTKYADRLEVNVTYNTGETYTVIDRIFPYKQRN